MECLSWDEIAGNAVRFAKRWENAAREKSQAQLFLSSFLQIFGVNDPLSMGEFEHPVPRGNGNSGFIDYFGKKYIAIEMKSRGANLGAAYEQLKNYIIHLPADEMPDLMMVCDFETMVLYHRRTGVEKKFKAKDLHKHVRRFATIAGYETKRDVEDQAEVNVNAAEKMAKLHDSLKMYGYDGHNLEVYLVRLLFCLFADDTGIFPQQSFHDYLLNSKKDGSDLSGRLAQLFDILNSSDEKREKRGLLSAELKQFRYINGRLFEAVLPPADFDATMLKTLLDCSSFDWNAISPAIFGAMFQGVMDKAKRRKLGAHYTSEENILKVIKPLFLNELWDEFERCKVDAKLLDRFHEKISKLKFLDPACGCGNFLIITYRELRRLEMEVLRIKIGSAQRVLDISTLLMVSVEQFYGIECEDFPCQIAQVGMWLIDHQMNMLVKQFGSYFVRLPLTQGATIVHGNALRIDWEEVVPKNQLSYILGNPPFVGFSMMSSPQKDDVGMLFPHVKNVDYVACWYAKAVQYMKGTAIECAFVSTNSICQGEIVPVLWKDLLEKALDSVDAR